MDEHVKEYYRHMMLFWFPMKHPHPGSVVLEPIT